MQLKGDPGIDSGIDELDSTDLLLQRATGVLWRRIRESSLLVNLRISAQKSS